MFQPQTPTRLVEDIQEIIKKEQDESDSRFDMDTSTANSVSILNKVCYIQYTKTVHMFIIL